MKYGIEDMEVGNEPISSKNMGELIVAKHRNGRSGTVLFKHNDSITRIYDYVPESFMPSGYEQETARPVVQDNKDIATNVNFDEPLRGQKRDQDAPF
jgi:hypothetical protein